MKGALDRATPLHPRPPPPPAITDMTQTRHIHLFFVVTESLEKVLPGLRELSPNLPRLRISRLRT